MQTSTRACVREYAKRWVACVSICFCAGWVFGQDRSAEATAEQILEISQIRAGVIVHYGCGDGRLAEALAQTESCVVEGLSPDAEQIKQHLPANVTVLAADSLLSAVRLSAQLAWAGDRVLLSPACASFDMFKSYEDRGEQFIAAVQEVMQ